jgi:hypothetical protein
MVRITTGQAAGEDDAGNATPAIPEKVPMKYNVKSELTYDVKPGEENVADFNLDSKGPIQKIEEE